MALTFTERTSEKLGRRAIKIYDVTHDGSTTDMSASSFGLHYIDTAMCVASGGGQTTNTPDLSISAATTVISFQGAMSAAVVQTLQVIGW